MLDFSNSTDPDVVGMAVALGTLGARAEEVGLEPMLVGASARTLWSIALTEGLPSRATQDVDVAVAVSSWDQLRTLTSLLTPEGNVEHRFVVEGVPVDVVPFGEVEAEDRTIRWADDHVMNVLGLREALDVRVPVLLPGGVRTSVPSVPALASLKVIAWLDRRLDTTRDAVDLAIIMGWWGTGPLLDEVYAAEHEEVLADCDFDPSRAGAALLGAGMADVLGPDGAAAVLGRLDDDSASRWAADAGWSNPVWRQRFSDLVAALGGRSGSTTGSSHKLRS
ncbi:nucleotidyl transferase AbiEii/AbiGii toxin family protein [Klenkia terrae]|jgi:predicted nucleotidyltransferase|uniref:Nucleotidyl transferase AbiEii/AbiGii toxin family protein n=1 Tax=Klenkia terrae TaxID=1052259 RepID=A0ABU8E8M3_9ACTN|nr:nucleotidyl transferase AbiEii/AbiGii toxin family protein [Klenkia terrae]SSC23824.1 Nucleotidyl transferase AbiEii toxin, Type IV TA system [Klenkia terrae]